MVQFLLSIDVRVVFYIKIFILLWGVIASGAVLLSVVRHMGSFCLLQVVP